MARSGLPTLLRRLPWLTALLLLPPTGACAASAASLHCSKGISQAPKGLPALPVRRFGRKRAAPKRCDFADAGTPEISEPDTDRPAASESNHHVDLAEAMKVLAKFPRGPKNRPDAKTKSGHKRTYTEADFESLTPLQRKLLVCDVRHPEKLTPTCRACGKEPISPEEFLRHVGKYGRYNDGGCPASHSSHSSHSRFTPNRLPPLDSSAAQQLHTEVDCRHSTAPKAAFSCPVQL